MSDQLPSRVRKANIPPIPDVSKRKGLSQGAGVAGKHTPAEIRSNIQPSLNHPHHTTSALSPSHPENGSRFPIRLSSLTSSSSTANFKFAMPKVPPLTSNSKDGVKKQQHSTYRYKPPNYIVTDVPDLWSNSKMEVIEEPSATASDINIQSNPPAVIQSDAQPDPEHESIVAALNSKPSSSKLGARFDIGILANSPLLLPSISKVSSTRQELPLDTSIHFSGNTIQSAAAVIHTNTLDSGSEHESVIAAMITKSLSSKLGMRFNDGNIASPELPSSLIVNLSIPESGISHDKKKEPEIPRKMKSRSQSSSHKSHRTKHSSKREKESMSKHSKRSTKKSKTKGDNSTSIQNSKPNPRKDIDVADILGLIEQNLTKEEGQVSDESDTESVTTMPVFSKDDRSNHDSGNNKRQNPPVVVPADTSSIPEKESVPAALVTKSSSSKLGGRVDDRNSAKPSSSRINICKRPSKASRDRKRSRSRSPRSLRTTHSSSDRRRKESLSSNQDRRVESVASNFSTRSKNDWSVRFGRKSVTKDVDENSIARRNQRSSSISKPETKKDGTATDILDLIEQHLSKEDGQVSEESDTESVTSVSKMSIFGRPILPKKSGKIKIRLDSRHKHRHKSHRSTERRSSVEGKNRSRSPTRKPCNTRNRSLSPLSRRRSLDRSRRQSVSPGPSITPRRCRDSPPPTHSRRHRASSYDTIASSQLDYPMLRKIAAENAIEFRRRGIIPPQYAMTPEERAIWRSGGKSLDDLTALCKRMAQEEHRKDDDRSSVASDLPIDNHPFHVKDRPLSHEISIHIKDGRNLPLRSGQERATQNLPLRQLYPVSTGSTHRDMTWQRVDPDREMHPRELKSREKIIGERDKEKAKKSETRKDSEEGPDDQPMSLHRQLANQLPPPDYRIPISFSDKLRLLKFQHELASNPDNPEVLSQMQNTHHQMMEWANQFQYHGAPGQFTGQAKEPSTPLYQPWDKQAWVRKDQLMHLAPVEGKGQYLLQKMGWVVGQAIGLRNKGVLEPLKMEIKLNKRGLQAEDEKRGQQQTVWRNGVQTVKFGGCADIHPCSALHEACTKRGWGNPVFELVSENGNLYGPKSFLFKVKINGVDYRPTVTGSSKKLAKAEVAKWCLDALGLLT